MTYLRKEYTEFEIFTLAKSLEEDQNARNWLKKNCQELAALSDVILDDNKSALKWLVKSNFDILVKFIIALRGDRDAFEYIFESDYKEWAAVISYLDDNSSVVDWFSANELNHFKLLAQTIRNMIQENDADSGSSAGGSGSSSGSFSGGGFGGFGGGSFGGGGGGAHW